MHTDTITCPATIINLLASTRGPVQVPTLPVKFSADRDFVAGDQWAEKLFSQARSASNDTARFAAGLLTDFSLKSV